MVALDVRATALELADRLEENVDAIAGFVRTPRQAVTLCAFLLRLDHDQPVEPLALPAPAPVTPATAPELARHRTPKPKPAINGVVRRDGGYTCPTCRATYAKAGNLERHINAMHAADSTEATPAATASIRPPKVDTTAAPSRSTSAGVASMCLSGSHAVCKAVNCSCHCHGGAGRSEVA